MKTQAPQAATNEFAVYKRIDLEIVSGQGMEVVDSQGRTYRDFYGGHAAALLGHSPASLVRALDAQASQIMFQTNMVEVEVRKRALKKLTSITPDGIERAFLVNSGAEAVENALRLAFKATNRPRVVALEGSFHGRTAGAGAVTHGALESWYEFPRTPFDVEFVAPGNVEALERALSNEVAALIIEPIQGVAGAIDLPSDYLQTARELTRKHGVILIADEVQSGMGRSGHMFAISASGVVPDILVVAKGLAGGFPAGAILTSAKLSQLMGFGDMGTTFGGGPLACAMIEVVCSELAKGALVKNAAAMELKVREYCLGQGVTAIQGAGLLLGLRTNLPASDVLAGLRARGILAGGAADPHVVRLMPPLIVEESDVKALATALKEIDDA